MPLHVFEPRYRKMVADALASHRTIGMVLLKPGYEQDYQGRPPIYPTGCTGTIVEEERLAEGRYEFREILGDIIYDDKRAGSVIRSLRSMLKREEGEKKPVILNEI